MCFFCCVSLRGTVYFMVTLHVVGTLGITLKAMEMFIFPPPGGYPDLNLNPAIVSQAPLLLAGYSLLASLFGCFIFRAVDMESVTLLKWSTLGFGVYQGLIIAMQFLFSIMFGDLLNKMGQAVLAGLLVLNFFSSLVYLVVLFLFGKQLKATKAGRNKLYKNPINPPGAAEPQQQVQQQQTAADMILATHENNWNLTQFSNYTKELNIPNLNFAQNHTHHPSVTRNSSISVGTCTNNNSCTCSSTSDTTCMTDSINSIIQEDLDFIEGEEGALTSVVGAQDNIILDRNL